MESYMRNIYATKFQTKKSEQMNFIHRPKSIIIIIIL